MTTQTHITATSAAERYHDLQVKAQRLLSNWDALAKESEPLLFTAASDEADAEALGEIKAEIAAIKPQYNALLLECHHERCVYLAAYLGKELKEVEELASLEALEAELKEKAEAQPLEGIAPQAHPTLPHTFVVAGTDWVVKELDQYPTKISIQLQAYAKRLAELTQDAALGKWEATLQLLGLFVLPTSTEGKGTTNINYTVFGGKPDRMDLITGEFDAQIEAYIERNKKILLGLPITTVLGLRDFFFTSMGRLLRSANEGGYGDILKNNSKNQPQTAKRNPEQEQYYSVFGLEELVNDLENWYRWNFDPQKGIYPDTVRTHYEPWELYLTTFAVILGMVRRKRLWDKAEIKAAKNKAEDYRRMVERLKPKK